MTTIAEKVGRITYERALLTLHGLVAGREHYVYPRSAGGDCMYFEDGNPIEVDENDNVIVPSEYGAPSCIVGHALAKWGVTYDDLPEIADDGDGDSMDPNTCGINRFARGLELEIEPKAMEFLLRAQSNQDLGAPWGEALDRAIQVAESDDWA